MSNPLKHIQEECGSSLAGSGEDKEPGVVIVETETDLFDRNLICKSIESAPAIQ